MKQKTSKVLERLWKSITLPDTVQLHVIIEEFLATESSLPTEEK